MFGITLTVRADSISGEWRYSLYSGEAMLTEYIGNSRDINIPSYIDGYPVTGIGYRIFYDSNITSLSIPPLIENIGHDAFSNCKYLSSIYFNARNCSVSVSHMQDAPFKNAGKFSESLTVTFGSSVQKIPNNLFCCYQSEFAHVTSVFMPNGKLEIGFAAFCNCLNLENVIWGEKITKIEDKAFEDCVNLQSVIIPECTEKIGGDAFNNCKNLKQINYNAKDCICERYSINTYFFDDAGKFSEFLILNIGNGVECIPPYLFSNTYVTTALIPESVKELGIHSFMNCKVLKNVTVKAQKVEYKDEMTGWYTPFGGCPLSVVFKCYRNSTTEIYAKNNGFKISYIDSAIDISKCKMRLSVSKYTYRGKECRPSVSLTYGSKKLTQDKDYTVTYRNNKYVGTASVIITGKGGFEGSVTEKFTIVPKGTVISWLSPVQKGINVGIKKQPSQTTGYEVQCYINSKFTNPKSLFTTRNTTTTAQIRKLSAGRKYYIRVRTYKTVAGKNIILNGHR